MDKCPYFNCKNMCRSIDSHKAYYATLRSCYKKNTENLRKVEEFEEVKEKPRSAKVNWEIYEKFVQTGLLKT